MDALRFLVLFVSLFVLIRGSFDLGWKYGELAFSKCKQKETIELKGMCGKFQEIVEDAFDNQGTSLQEAFGNAFSKAIEVANRPAFAKFGEKTLDDTINWMIENKVKDYEKLKGEYIQKFFKWFAEVLKEVDKPGSGLQDVEIPERFDYSKLPPIPREEL